MVLDECISLKMFMFDSTSPYLNVSLYAEKYFSIEMKVPRQKKLVKIERNIAYLLAKIMIGPC
jgi:hypothetical protein